MKVDGNGHADRDFLVYSWLPERDCEFNIQTNEIVYRQSPVSHVFVAIVKPYEAPLHGMLGEVVRWHWVDEDPQLALAPKGFASRYDKHYRRQ